MGELYGDCELALRLDVVARWEWVREHCQGEGGGRRGRGRGL